MADLKRRRGEQNPALRARQAQDNAARSATAKQSSEDANAPWIKMWEQETGKKYGLATAGKYKAWIAAKRKKRALSMRDMVDVAEGR